MSTKVLIVEDEKKLSALLRDYLKQSDYETDCVFRGEEAVERLRAFAPDMVLLDLNLPGRDGLDICKDIRAFSNIPIIMITARVEEIDRLLGLELGADDYICKPFSPREVVARVKTVLRRSKGAAPAVDTGLSLDPQTYKATLDGQDIGLTAVEFNLLQLLAIHPGRIYSRQQLMDQIYPDGRVVTDRAIDSHVKKLRRKIAQVEGRELIHSIYSVGYKFEWGA